MTHHCDGVKFTFHEGSDKPYSIQWTSDNGDTIRSADGKEWFTIQGFRMYLSEALTDSFNDWVKTGMQYIAPCPFCEGTPELTDLDDEDDRRIWVRELHCDTCDLVMRDWITWNTYVSMTKEQASLLVASQLIEKWNKRP